jgi:Flp pilus assembly pilin Flp
MPWETDMGVRRAVERHLRDDGQDLMEYALLAALVSLVAFAAVSQVGTTVRDVFWSVIAATVAAV